MTPARLQEMIEADRMAPIYQDRFGGRYVLRKDAAIHGQRAMIHRRELLAALAEIQAQEDSHVSDQR